jgi:anthranilate synthase/aminodeoxychorismate synthase-like glutamine amidotransferase
MVFVLDNYDSFTYNLVQYLGELGAKVEVHRNDELTVEQVEALHPERILLSPGPCTPSEAGILVPLIRHMAGKAPILRCLPGASRPSARPFGGQVVRARHLMHGKTSPVDPRRQGHLRRTTLAAHLHPLPLAGRGRGIAPCRTHGHCPHAGRRRLGHHGPAPSQRCPSRACSSTPRAS